MGVVDVLFPRTGPIGGRVLKLVRRPRAKHVWVGMKEIVMRFSRFAVLSTLASAALILGGCCCGECEKKDAKASAGMVGNKEACDKGAGCCKAGAKASMGAVSEKKEGCSAEKAGCASKAECPATKN
jgi:hypothetical protein